MKNLILITLLSFFCIHAEDDVSVAENLATNGANNAAKGKIDVAKEFFCMALASDPNCATALFEMAKLAEKEGDKVLAGDLFHQASGKVKDPAKQAYIDSHLKFLNPGALKLMSSIGQYVKKQPDDKIPNPFETPMKDPVAAFNPVGKWRNKEVRLWEFTANHEIKGGDLAGGTWEFTDGVLTLRFAKWHGDVVCTIIDNDSFEDGCWHSNFKRIKSK